ncbi:hypothetical protein [Adhaeribacter aquaticus]|uniref:hypothetical protein n=1 Tax=Adhaeribacter aquaticus TaxID=299567 RepID=UPI00047B5F22|nr:hypothetical protein [Adhaeribacter aquaticus]
MKLKLLAIAVSMAALTSCEELFDDGTKLDGSTPYIMLSSPNENSVFAKNQNVAIHSEITDKDNINQLDVNITQLNQDGSKALWGFSKQPKKNPVILDTTFNTSNLAAGNYLLSVTTIDGRNNTGTKEIKFTISN